MFFLSQYKIEMHLYGKVNCIKRMYHLPSLRKDIGASPPPRDLGASPPPQDFGESDNDNDEAEDKTPPPINMMAKYIAFSPHLVRKRNKKLRRCKNAEKRREIFKTYYIKLKEVYFASFF
jgi:hypothetical protein